MKKALILAFLLTVFFGTSVFGQNKSIPAKGFAIVSEEGKFQPIDFQRHALGDNDILIETIYSSICHTDIHQAHGDWGKAKYPIVPGHEIAGRVIRIGKNVTKFKIGDYAGVGCMVNSCGECEYCKQGLEQYCLKGSVGTYSSVDYYHNNEITKGGYSNNMVVSENFAIKIPDSADLKRVAPLLCAGITTYSPMHFAGVKKGDKVGVAGFGGLGHLALKYAVKVGAEVTVFDITEDKRADAFRLGAVKYVNINNTQELNGLNNTFNYLISTIPSNYDLNMYLKMIKFGGKLAVIGIPSFANMPTIRLDQFVWSGNRFVFGSLIGGIKETQEMLDYSVANNIYPEVEIINASASSIEDAYKNVLNGKVKFRYVIDMKTLK